MLEKLSLFFDKIKNITFWDRVLPWAWKSIKALSFEAYHEYRQLIESLTQTNKELEQAKTNIATLKQENNQLNTTNTRFDKDLSINKNEIARLGTKIEGMSQGNSTLKEEIAGLKKSEADVLKQYEKQITVLHETQTRIENEREQEKKAQHEAEIQRINSLKENWSIHETTVKEAMKTICQKHTIEYVEKTPFRGDPDNTIKICDEYIIFDAKSPGTEDLKNFSKYIRNQTETIKKYANQESVKKDIFLVIPFNTVDVIDQFSFNMGAYNVYIITVDALEPIMLALRKIEDYEFAEELTPEERDNICRIIGRFAHTTKRRIQIDYFFAHQFLDILTKSESDIPHDMVEKVEEFEKAEKLNPPVEKRARQILTKELTKDVGKIKQAIEAKEITLSTPEDIKSIPLYKEDKSEN